MKVASYPKAGAYYAEEASGGEVTSRKGLCSVVPLNAPFVNE